MAKVSFKSSANRPIPCDLSRNHYTTLNFGRIYPIMAQEVINNTKISCKVSNFTRLAPMLLPNLGTLKLKMHAFYIPFNLVWRHFENFKEGKVSWTAKGNNRYTYCPMIDTCTLCDILSSVGFANVYRSYNAIPSVNGNKPFDFCYDDGSGQSYVQYVVLSPKGKYFHHLFNALGYNFNFINTNISDTAIGSEDEYVEQYSALPLLCWCKMFLDYFIPSQLQPSSNLHLLLRKIDEMSDSELRRPLQASDFLPFLNEMYRYYRGGYFSSAWNTPNAPLEGVTVFDDVRVNYDIDATDYSGENQLNQSVKSNEFQTSANLNDGSVDNLSSDTISLIKKFSNFIRKAHYAGSRAVEALKARFGIRVEDFNVGLSRYCGSDELDLQKSDVTVTGNSEEAGEYAGMAIFAGNGHNKFSCDCDYAGYWIITASIDTPSSFVTGVRRQVKHIKPFDFYTPEFDGTLKQAIFGSELYSDIKILSDVTIQNLDAVGLTFKKCFGFQDRFQEYKQALDDITGDFRLTRFNGNIDAFILPRQIFNEHEFYEAVQNGQNPEELQLYQSSYNPAVQNGQRLNPQIILRGDDSNQFNRIFKDTSGIADPFFSVFKIDAVFVQPVLPLDEANELAGRGKQLEFEKNGVHLD